MATNTGIRMTLGLTREWTGGDGRHYRSEQWAITGGEVYQLQATPPTHRSTQRSLRGSQGKGE